MKQKNLLVISVISVFLISCQPKQMTLTERLETLLSEKIEKIEADSMFSEAYEIDLIQPIDHNDPAGKTFTQQIFLSYVGPDRPVVVVTEGYGAKNYTSELADILKCNQIIIEHRYFDESTPDSIDWNYLTTWQSASDQHEIIELFKPVFTGKWITTGISNGGSNVMFHSYYFPNDVDIRVPYVGPLIFGQEDPRIYEFLASVGTPEERVRIFEFQKLVLTKRDDLFPMMIELAAREGWTFERVGGAEVAFEMTVLEYDFSFWQRGGITTDAIPLEGTDNEIFKNISEIGDFSYFSDQEIKEYEPFYYQALTETGYYGYQFDKFKDYLKYAKDSDQPDFAFGAPQGVILTFDNELMQKVNRYIQNRGNNFCFIYGRNDTWSAASIQLNGRTNSIKVLKNGGDHKTRINNLNENDRTLVLSTLSKWLGEPITDTEAAVGK
jgi:hypothetical protein